MNILQILPALESGGVERGTLELTRYLIAQGHKAVVISCGGRMTEDLAGMGGKHYCLDVHRKSLFSILKLIPKVARIINEEKIDIVHARSRVPAWIAFFATRMSSAVLITTCHGYYGSHFFSRVMGWGKRVIVISHAIGRHMIDDFKVPQDKIRLVYRGVDTEKFTFRNFFVRSKQKDKSRIGIIGRLSPIKGHADFLNALPQVISKMGDVEAQVIGEVSPGKEKYLEELKKLVSRLNLEQKVKFLGNVKDVPGALKGLDVLVMATTVPEAFGRVIVEAGAVGVPVVATRVGGVVEIIKDAHDGILVEPHNSYELAEAIARMLCERPFAAFCAENLLNKVKNSFTLDKMLVQTESIYKEVLTKKKILIFKLSALGDVILISAALRAVRQKFPEAEIDCVVADVFKDILMGCPYIDNLVVIKNKNIPHIFKKILSLRRREYDLSIDFQNNNLSHILAAFTAVPKRYGYRNNKLGCLLNCGIKETKPGLSPVEHQFRLLQSLGIEAADEKLELWITERHQDNVADFLREHWVNENQLLVGINPCASTKWKTKLWTKENYARLADRMATALNARILFTGMKKDARYIDDIINISNCKPVNAAGKTSLMELAALIGKFRVFLTTDSAPMHICAAVGTPFVALFGPTDPKRHLPKTEKFVLINKALTCSPCYRKLCFNHKCLKSISVEEVFKAMLELINGNGGIKK
ncbi:MAG: glycosyltransferase family 9 protein [Candidatus Omnitrophota bacterium]